jgi:hypothetical protein
VDVSEMQKKLSLWATENPTEQRRERYNLLCNDSKTQGRLIAWITSNQYAHHATELRLRLTRKC